MQTGLREAEIAYAPRFQEAEAIEDPELKQKKLDSLRNTFGTKQSIIRKKYGVRLRERRTKAEIQAERERMGLPTETAPSTQPPTQYSHSPIPAPAYGHQQTSTASAWAAANKRPAKTSDQVSPANKRQRSEIDLGPTTKVSEMAGGLSASAADAAMHDPTVPSPQRAASSAPLSSSEPSITYEQSGARVEVHLPGKPASSSPANQHAEASGGDSDMMVIEKQLAEDLQGQGNNSMEAAQYDGAGDRDEGENDENENENEDNNEQGRQEEAEDEEDEEKQQQGQQHESDSDSDDSDDEDIPPTLPPSSGHAGLSHQGHRLGM
jgi:hypothetical protein